MSPPGASGARLPNLSELGASFMKWGSKVLLEGFYGLSESMDVMCCHRAWKLQTYFRNMTMMLWHEVVMKWPMLMI